MEESSCHQKMTEYICVPCEETFQVKNDSMKHRKHHHLNRVLLCKHYKESFTCQFGEKCWFRHEKNQTENIIENHRNHEITDKIFQMLEQFTKRMVMLEEEVKSIKQLRLNNSSNIL